MKTLLIVRHGEAVRGENDRDRALTAAGRLETANLGQRLKRRSLVPDFVLCSPARRAKETWREISAAFGGSVQKRVVEALYPGEPGEIMAAVATVPESVAILMLIGHNPGMQAIAGKLSASGEAHAMSLLAAGMPTAACAELVFPAERWDALDGGALIRLFTPRSDSVPA
jgi:phosphohistidine phosphatase